MWYKRIVTYSVFAITAYYFDFIGSARRSDLSGLDSIVITTGSVSPRFSTTDNRHLSSEIG
jgi:hypothetical protein